MAKRGEDPPGAVSTLGTVGSDVIFSERRGQSQKPEEIYQLIEQIVPGGESCGAWGWGAGRRQARHRGALDSCIFLGKVRAGQGRNGVAVQPPSG